MSPQKIERNGPTDAESNGRTRLSVVLPHTDLALTEIALREASRMARGLDVRVTVLAVQIVPFPALLDPTRGCPCLPELLAMAESADAPVTIQIVYARDWESACEQVMEQSALVVIAVRKGWLRSREERLAAHLVRSGHKVTTIPA